MKREEFYFDSRDGISKIRAIRYEPDDGQIKCIVQVVHGMAEHIERYEGFAEYMTSKGFVVVGNDHLGHGKSVKDGGVYGYFCKQDPATVVVRDAHRLKKMTQALFPGKPYVVLGHSMGSFILRNYLFKYSSGIDGAVILGTGMPAKGYIMLSKLVASLCGAFCGQKHVAYLIDKLGFGSYNKRIQNPKTAYDWLSKDPAAVEKYVEDKKCGFVFTVNGFKTLFELIYRLHSKENLSNISKELPIILLSGDADPVGEYGRGVKRAFDSIKSAGVENISMKLYENDRHELLNETDKDVVMQDICNWINAYVLG